MSWASFIPNELTIQPLPLVVLTGLDIKHNALHKEIWDGFNSRSNQKFRYKLLDGDHEYPKCKNKKPTEFYIPKGIFKTNWLNKHLNLIPSIVVVFFELDWDEPNWKEKQMECATKVELVRHCLLDRNTRLILILIQKHPNIPVDGDNLLARERYPALCTACSIKNNYLFLLHAEHLHGYIIKLEEDAFTEPTQTYYTLEIKAVKFKRDSLIKVTHQFLFVRLAFKIAFFNEMKLDLFKAIEYYKHAYLSLLDIRIYDSNIFEIKTVAGMINYKLCQLFFEIKHPIDAIDQFRKHIDIFRIKVGPAELSFEHSAWLSKQFQLMGEIFEEAIKKGYLNAVQTQHPGFYFHSAANNSLQRRIHSKEFFSKNFISKDQFTDENPSPIEFLNSLEFYGQRPWRQGQQGMEILDQQKEKDGILCLQELESRENLTPLIIELYKQAITHFKVFNCKRMKQYLSVCMAEEYYFAKNYQEALNIYVNVLNEYNSEHWWPILTSIMTNAYKCAFLVADITNYCLISIELIGKNVLLSSEEKSQIQTNLLRIIENKIPLIEPHKIDSNVHSIENAIFKWNEELKSSESIDVLAAASNLLEKSQSEKSLILAANKIIPAHVSGMVPFVECKVRFSSLLFNSNQIIELAVYMRTDCVDPIQFNKLYIHFNNSSYNQYCIVENTELLLFQQNKIKEFKFNFLPLRQDIGKDLEVISIILELGNRNTRVLIMQWKGDCKNAITNESNTLMSFSRKLFPKLNLDKSDSINLETLDWKSINNISSASIVARKANIELKLEHKMPIFVDEYYAIKITIDNREETKIENLILTAEFQANANDNTSINEKRCHLWIGNIDKTKFKLQQNKELTNIESKNQASEIIYVQLKEIMSVNLIIKINYKSGQENFFKFSNSPLEKKEEFDLKSPKQLIKCTCIQEDQLKLDSIYPFKFNFSFLSMQMKPIDIVRYGEPFILLCETKNETPYSLKFKNSLLNKSSNIRFKPSYDGKQDEVDSLLKGEVLKHHEFASECYCIMIDEPSPGDKLIEFNTKSTSKLGEYFVEWRRQKICSILENNKNEDEEDEEQDDNDEENELENLFNVTTKIDLPEINVEFFPFLIETLMPTYGCLNEHLTINYKIKNKSNSYILDIECTLDENEFFSIAGNKLEFIQIMPNDSTNYTFIIFPLQPGYCKLPKFHIKINNFDFRTNKLTSTDQVQQLQQQSQSNLASLTNNDASVNSETNNSNKIDLIIQSMLPSQLFIMPKNSSNIAVSK